MSTVDIILRVAGAVGLPALLLWYLRDRRKTNAAGAVAERTVGADVTKADAGALEAHVLAVERAFEVERSSKDRVIGELRAQVVEIERTCERRVMALTNELADKEGVVADLRTQVATLTDRLTEVTAEFGVLRDRLNHQEGQGTP